jgi:hypothetical protein
MEGNEQASKTYMVFDSQDDAIVAKAVIAYNMHLSGSISLQHATEQQRLDGKWVLEPAEERYMARVSGYVDTQECTDADRAVWFGESEEGK